MVLRDPAGEPLIVARVDATAISGVRQHWRALTFGMAGFVVAATLLLLGAALAEWRHTGPASRFYAGTLALALLVVLVRLLAWVTVPPGWHSSPPTTAADAGTAWVAAAIRSPLDLLLHGLMLLALVGLGVSALEHRRRTGRARRRSPDATAATVASFLVAQLAAGVAAVAIFAAFNLVLRFTIERMGLDVLRLSLHPYQAQRLLPLAAIIFLQAAALWCAVLALVNGASGWRVWPERAAWGALQVALWMMPAVALAATASWRQWRLPLGPLLLSIAVAVVLAVLWRRGSHTYRHGSQARRVVFAVLALIVPALLVYPLLVAESDLHTRRSIVETVRRGGPRAPEDTADAPERITAAGRRDGWSVRPGARGAAGRPSRYRGGVRSLASDRARHLALDVGRGGLQP